MAWNAERIDKNNDLARALRMVGFNGLGPLEVELILNLSRLIEEKGDKTTMRDISETESCVRGLFEESADTAQTNQ